MRHLVHITRISRLSHHHRLPARTTERACAHVHLALHDGVERDYLLDDPGERTPAGGERLAYEPRVHLAYILARQGHDARWLAEFADLPHDAAHRIAELAASPSANGPK
ncbi:hypothetical protein ACFP1Z_32905 [Streptomyces gamaensis]|uniref:Uncharacterized protein n=1 Tax=Streptomyces gamaensis TaxID=1763542 RepID=A0ABW0Z826_9ACTN